jgi:CRP/FNR family cyclic AMP-dependent transcriptional regulator
MPCPAHELRHVQLFSLLDDEELAILASQVELRQFNMRQTIYKVGDPGDCAYILLSGRVQLTTIDEDHQEVELTAPAHGDPFGFASMLDQTPHQTTAMALEECSCVEVDRNDIIALIQSQPMAGLDMLTVLARQFHASQETIRIRAAHNPNVLIEEEETFGERIADHVASFGGSWTFIILFGVVLAIYTAINVALRGRAWDPYPFILLNLFLSMLAAIQAPVIMMSQNRQDKKDRLRSELDFDVNVRSESEIQSLARRLSLLHEKLDDVHDHILESRKP